MDDGLLALTINPLLALLAFGIITYSLIRLRHIKYILAVSIFLMLTILLLLLHSVIRIFGLGHVLFAAFLSIASFLLLFSILSIYYKIPVHNIQGRRIA